MNTTKVWKYMLLACLLMLVAPAQAQRFFNPVSYTHLDFVANGADFIKLTSDILDAAIAAKAHTLDEVKTLKVGDADAQAAVTPVSYTHLAISTMHSTSSSLPMGLSPLSGVSSVPIWVIRHHSI